MPHLQLNSNGSLVLNGNGSLAYDDDCCCNEGPPPPVNCCPDLHFSVHFKVISGPLSGTEYDIPVDVFDPDGSDTVWAGAGTPNLDDPCVSAFILATGHIPYVFITYECFTPGGGGAQIFISLIDPVGGVETDWSGATFDTFIKPASFERIDCNNAAGQATYAGNDLPGTDPIICKDPIQFTVSANF